MASLPETEAKFRADLDRRDRQASTRLVRAYIEPLKTLNAEIDALVADIQRMKSEGKPINKATLAKSARLQQRLLTIEGAIGGFSQAAQKEVVKATQDAVELAKKASNGLLSASLGDLPDGITIPEAFLKTDPKAVEVILGKYSAESPYVHTLSKYPKATADLVEQILVDAVIKGVNPEVARRQLQSKLSLPLNGARATARTAMIGAYRDTSLATYRANDDIVKGWRWTAHKSTRTCMVCIAMDGKEFPLDTPFGSHVSCRCTPTPITPSWKELGLDIPDNRRPYETGSSWFKSLPESERRKMVGPNVYDQVMAKYRYVIPDMFVGYKDDKVWGPSRFVRSGNDILTNAVSSNGTQNAPLPNLAPLSLSVSPAKTIEKVATPTKLKSSADLFEIDPTSDPRLKPAMDEACSLMDRVFSLSDSMPKVKVQTTDSKDFFGIYFQPGLTRKLDGTTVTRGPVIHMSKTAWGSRSQAVFKNNPQKVFIHEFGHYIDNHFEGEKTPKARQFGGSETMTESVNSGKKASTAWVRAMDAIMSTSDVKAYQEYAKKARKGSKDEGHYTYMASPRECFARAVEDYVYRKTSKKVEHDAVYWKYKEESYKQFEPALDDLFRELGILK